MTRDEAIEFLLSHQPMPLPSGLSDELCEAFAEALKVAKHAVNDEPLLSALLGSLSFGLGIYEDALSVVSTIENAATREVVLRRGLESDSSTTIYWACRAASEAPSLSLMPTLERVCHNDDPAIRMVAAEALAATGPTGLRAVRTMRASESDSTVMEHLDMILE